MQSRAIALVTDSVIKSPLRDYLTRSCHRAGLSLEFHSVTHNCKSYVERFHAHQNIITWNCRMPHEWMTNKGKNLLFIENSLTSTHERHELRGGLTTSLQSTRIISEVLNYAAIIEPFRTCQTFHWAASRTWSGRRELFANDPETKSVHSIVEHRSME